MDKLQITIALERYDRHFPFFDGSLRSERLAINALQVGQGGNLRDGSGRHRRMLRDSEFDCAEVSLSSYLVAVDKGLPFTAVPIFPRRLFSQSQTWVREDSPLEHPSQLAGRRVLISAFQTTLSLLGKGDLKFEYQTPWEEVTWMSTSPEELQVPLGPKVKLHRMPPDTDAGLALSRGDVDAVMLPRPPASITSGVNPLRRLFRDTMAEERRYFHKYGYFPIMHVIALRSDVVERAPWLPGELMEVWRRSDEIAQSYYTDPNWSRMAWGRHLFERERTELGNRLWPIGLQANRANLERMIDYSFDQGLITRRLTAGELFFPAVRDS